MDLSTEEKFEEGDPFKIMAKQEGIQVRGKVVKALPNASFRIVLENGHEILAYISGSMKKNYIRILPDDTVLVELSAYDLNRGRIVYREK